MVCTGGAGQLAGPAGLCRRLGLDLAGIEIALRDLDDLAGNARRVVAATSEPRARRTTSRSSSSSPSIPAAEDGWLAAADVVAEAELRLKFRTGGLDAGAFPVR